VAYDICDTACIDEAVLRSSFATSSSSSVLCTMSDNWPLTRYPVACPPLTPYLAYAHTDDFQSQFLDQIAKLEQHLAESTAWYEQEVMKHGLTGRSDYDIIY
jgi:hypothetical protein